VTTDNPNQYRVSSNFTFLKIFAIVANFAILVNVINDLISNTYTQNSLIGIVLGAMLLFAVFYFLKTRQIIEYDDINLMLYVFNSKNQLQTEIPLANIESIMFSILAIKNYSYSYIITYRDFHNTKQKVRLFAIPFKNEIDVIIRDTKLCNPNLKISKWHF
jgi:hypothetical protein